MCTGTHTYIPASNTAKVEVFFRQDSQQIENVFHVRGESAWSEVSLAELVNEFANWVSNTYADCWHTSCHAIAIKATDLSSVSGPVIESALDPEVAGVETGSAALPSNVSLVIKWTTTQRGRSFRGRTYVPGLAAAFVSANTITPTYHATVVGAASQLWSAIRAKNWDLVVVSYCNEKEWRTSAAVTQITGWSVDTTLDSQRRRLPGRGR